MKRKHVMAFLGVATPMIWSSGAQAAFTGLTVELHTSVSINGTMRSVYRVYADFTQGGDRLFFWGAATSPVASIVSSSSNFFNPGGSASNTAPTQLQIGGGSGTTQTIPGVQWGTFATIGVNIAEQGVGELGGTFPDPGTGDLTQLSPGFPTFITGSILNFSGGVFLPGDLPGDAQNRADFAGDGDAALRVMMMQLTVNAGSSVHGTIPRLTWMPQGSSSTVAHPVTLTFHSVPAPGGLALLALAGLRRRRRRPITTDRRCLEARS